MRQNTFVKLLRVLILLLGTGILVFCILLPNVAERTAEKFPEFAYLQYPVLFYVYLTAVPFYIALFQGVRICGFILNDEPFSHSTVSALQIASVCSVTEIFIYTLGAVLLFCCNALHPSIFLLILVILLAASMFALLCSILKHLVQKAIRLREESELTI